MPYIYKVMVFFMAIIMLFMSVSGDFNSPAAAQALSDKESSRTTKETYAYIAASGKDRVLSAQQSSDWLGEDYEMNYLLSVTGKLPAIQGFDYMGDAFDSVNAAALEWARAGGIVTICWHTGPSFTGGWTEAMNDKLPDWNAALTDGTPQNRALLAGMDKAAAALAKLRDEGVTVLWRPFHEFDGQWFWWGKGGSANFIRLWRLMYDRYTGFWGLNNLIWVLGYSDKTPSLPALWYPGDSYCDVIGADSYKGGAQRGLYDRVRAVTRANKPFCFHECGTAPTVDELRQVPWTWFMVWHTDLLTQKNSKEALNELYNSDYVITRDELPDFAG